MTRGLSKIEFPMYVLDELKRDILNSSFMYSAYFIMTLVAVYCTKKCKITQFYISKPI